MRTWVNLSPPKDFDPRLIKLFKQINLNGQQQSTAMYRVGQGVSPDNAGISLFDGTPYFKLAGRAGGQSAAGGVAGGDNLTLSSTTSTTKGKIYLGAASTFDEGNVLLGINTTAPLARLEVHGAAPTYTAYPPISVYSNPGVWKNNLGNTTNLPLYIGETIPDDTTYITDNGYLGGMVFLRTGPITPVASTGSVYIIFRMRWTGTNGGTAGADFTPNITDGGGVAIPPSGGSVFWTQWVPPGAHGNVAIRNFYYHLSAAQITTLGAGSPKWDYFQIELKGSGGGVGYSGAIECTYLAVVTSGIPLSSTNIFTAYNAVGDLITKVTPSACISTIGDSAGGQVENSFQVTDALGTIQGGFTPAGAPFYITGAAAGNFLKTTSTAGVGAWTAPAALTATTDNNIALYPTVSNCVVAASRLDLVWSGTLSKVRGGNGAADASVASNLTAQTASIAAQTILTGAAATGGMYCVSVYIKTTTAGSALDVVKATITWNDGTAQTLDVPFENATTVFNNHDLATLNAFAQGSIVVNAAASQNINYTTTVVKTGTPQYEIHVRIKALS